MIVKILIWVLCIFISSLLQVLLSYAGIKGFLIQGLILFTSIEVANKLCKIYDVHREEEKKTKQLLQSKPNNSLSDNSECVYCHRCGKKLPINSLFCDICGTKLELTFADNTVDTNAHHTQIATKLPRKVAIGTDGLPYKTDRKYKDGWGKQFNAFITPQGKYYHKSKCRYCNGHQHSCIHVYTAINKGYLPCPYCKPKDKIDDWYNTVNEMVGQ